MKYAMITPSGSLAGSISWDNILILPDLSLLHSIMLSNVERISGPHPPPLLTHEPFALTTSNLMGC